MRLMKTFAIILFASVFCLGLSSCLRQSCGCQLQGAYFNNDSIFITSADYKGTWAYWNARDSLRNKYYVSEPHDTILKSVDIGKSYGHNASQNDRMKQLEAEGYICICAN
jgi:hypothetical protein